MIAYKGNNGEVCFNDQRVDGPGGDLGVEAVVNDVFGDGGVGLVDTDANGMFGRTLRDEDDVDLVAGEGFEESFGEAGDADHAAAFEAEQGDPGDAGDAADAVAVGDGVEFDDGARVFGGKGIFDPYGNVLPHDGLDRRRVDHFRPKVRELHRFLIGDTGDEPDVGYEAWVGGHHAGYIGPDLQAAGVDSGGEDSGGIVGAATAERGGDPFFIGGDEAG